MKKLTIKKSTIVYPVIFLLFLHGTALGESLQLNISCTIPAIPGLNAPLVEQETIKTKNESAKQEKIEAKEEPQLQITAMIQQDIKEETANQEQKAQILVKSLYPR